MRKVINRNRLYAMEAATYPNMKTEDARRLHKSIYKESVTEEHLQQKAVSTDKISSLFGGSINEALKDLNGR